MIKYPKTKSREYAATGFLAVLLLIAFVALVAILFCVSVALTTVIILAAWNWCGLHSLFGLEELSFWQAAGAGFAIVLLRSIFRTRVTVNE
jgi:hypothetical protein